jgi:hypothetical protein
MTVIRCGQRVRLVNMPRPPHGGLSIPISLGDIGTIMNTNTDFMGELMPVRFDAGSIWLGPEHVEPVMETTGMSSDTSETNRPILLTSRESDEEKAARHRAALTAKLDELCPLLDAAQADGLEVSYGTEAQSLSGNPRGARRNIVKYVTLFKHY